MEYAPSKNVYIDTNQSNVRFRVPDYAVSESNCAIQYITTSAYTGTLATMIIY